MKFLSLLMIYLVLCSSGCTTQSHTRSGVEGLTDEQLVLQWRSRQTTIAAIESAQDFPQGNQAWMAFARKVHAGDELWYFCSPGPTWANMMGWEGYALFRGGHLVETYTLREN